MKVLATGATGLLGANTVKELNSRGFEVKALLRPGSGTSGLEGTSFEIAQGDILSYASVSNAMKGCHYVIHTAALTPGSSASFEDFIGVNITGTQNVIKAAATAGIQKIIHVGSSSTFGAGTPEQPGDELSEFEGYRFNSGYINSKFIAQQWVLSEVEKHGSPVIVVNPSNIIGPRDSHFTTGRFITSAFDGKIRFCPKGKRNFVDVREVAAACVNALERGVPGECYLLTGENLSMAELYRKVDHITHQNRFQVVVPPAVLRTFGVFGSLYNLITGKKQELNYSNAKLFSSHVCYSGRKATEELGLVQRPIDDAIYCAIKWYADHGLLDKKIFPAINENRKTVKSLKPSFA